MRMRVESVSGLIGSRSMAEDVEDDAIVHLYVERGGRRYATILPEPVLVYLGAALSEFCPRKDDAAFLGMLRTGARRGPRRAPVAETVEPPRLSEERERMLDELGLDPEAKRQLRGAMTDDNLARVSSTATRWIGWLMEQVDEATFDPVFDAGDRTDVRVTYLTIPAGTDREACDRALTRWVDLSFAAFLADLMVELAKPGDLSGRRTFFPAVRVFRGASRRLLPDDQALFATYHRDDEGFVVVAAVRDVTCDEEQARYEAFLERLAVALDEEVRQAQAPMTLAEGQEVLAWLAAWVGPLDEHAVH
jgi:hypothetical protein